MKQFIAVLFVIGIIGAYFWWIVLFAAIVGGAWLAKRAVEASDARRAQIVAENAAIAARADREHEWTLAGDERGFYGQYPPA
ncbi:hypothetical protein [[Mycobacterium] zoologicum]|uniref:hypothetical protein n=1 Tax=[Mycobacterium] zoologicum TaxID=2872311 RepID=UPI001CDAC826|nr:hypothetical protein [Mycolicibacter sp. MYC101]MEB3065328.1 hypothetical protein [Mycolicibacter sp. MYC101]